MINAELKKGTAHLIMVDKDWERLIAQVGACTIPFKAEREPYEALLRAVAYQQLSTKVGDVILVRFVNLFNQQFPSTQQLLNTPFTALRACGFSARKIETLQRIAQAREQGIVPTRTEAEKLTNEMLITRLVSIKGIGRWTVEMMLIFTLQRLDILPIEDLGVREGYKRLKKMEAAPSPKVLAIIGEAWAPYRTIASWYLWQVPKVQ
jgi:DNA-3-methyladenine glycosylase II